MERITRRRFLRDGLAIGGTLALPWSVGIRSAFAAPGGRLSKYVQPLPVPGAGIVVATPSGANTYAFTQRQISRQLHPDLPPTPLWAYDDGTGLAGQAGSFGMALQAQSGVPLSVGFTHGLPATYPSWIPVDTRFTPLGNQVRTLTHLHGGFVSGTSDGSPATHPLGFGPGETQTVLYPNQRPQMPASMRWMHDHAMGATRLNVFAGLAGAYILRDELDTGMEPNPIGIPGGRYEIPLVVQDRLFNADGTFLYPTSDIAGVTWIGEYFGDVMLVNGKVWPFAEVEPRMYRLRILNGCNSRILTLDMGPSMWQIGGDGGLFDIPVPIGRVVLAPAERADVLVDFSRFAGHHLVMKNHRPKKPVSNPAPQLESVMQFRVGTAVTQPGPASIPSSLPGLAPALVNPVATRYITLNEVDAEEADWRLNINGVAFGEGAITEQPRAGTVEDWVFINMTGDTHPIHLHLVTFQVVGRTPFDADAFEDQYGIDDVGVPGGIDPGPFATGPMRGPDPGERGFKDTVMANPGEFTRIRARFELPAGVAAPQQYVYHCHMLEHEDNEMMRPFTVIA